MSAAAEGLWLAPLRGVTIRTFRSVFGDAIREAGFSGLYAPFIPVNAGFRFSKRLFADILPKEGEPSQTTRLVPQAIGKDPAALREWCKAVRDLGYVRADLNAGCPFPMIRRKGRGSGLLRTPDVLERHASFTLRGTVNSNVPMTSVEVDIIDLRSIQQGHDHVA